MFVGGTNIFYTVNNINTFQLAKLGTPILFLSYVNDLPSVCKVLDPVMFVNSTNLFYSDDDLNTFCKKLTSGFFLASFP